MKSCLLVQVPVYSVFAQVYDRCMKNVPYEQWARFIALQLEQSGLGSQARVLDLGCGTGILLKKLEKKYPRIAGLDLSRQMLQVARQKSRRPLLQADMTSLPLAGSSFDFVFSVHDAVNYLQTEKNLRLHLAEMARVLKSGGFYLFDLSSESNVLENFDQQTFVETHRNTTLRWSNRYDRKKKEIISTLVFSDLQNPFHQQTEVHCQKIFAESDVLQLARESGFELRRKDADYGKGRSESASFWVYLLQKKQA